MKTTIVPAQVTTVEDKIAGNISMHQLLLLVVPIFIGSGLFVILPPFFSYAVYKVVMIAIIASICALLAIRIRGKILLFWLAVLLKYNLRPRYYVFNKNDSYLREDYDLTIQKEIEEEEEQGGMVYSLAPALSLGEVVTAEQLLANPNANFRLEINKKGRLSVHITEI
jgi:hypothetical protein